MNNTSPLKSAANVALEPIAARSAAPTGGTAEINVLVRITPAVAVDNGTVPRPALNLGLVIDRSGSMGGQKIEQAKQAASYAVDQLRGDDRVSVVVFDDEVDVPVPSTEARDKADIQRRIGRIAVDGSTALHAGWVEGGTQVGTHLDPARLNRVILFTDGQANKGEVRPDTIAGDVRGLAQRGVSTTAMGIGADYNEDLLEAMARAGDGNYYFIERGEQLADIFASELRGLLATGGRTVSLGIEPSAGVEVLDVYNDCERNRYGRLRLPNLVAGQPIEIVLRLRVDGEELFAGAGAGERKTACRFRLAWDDPRRPGERQVLREKMRLAAVGAEEFARMEPAPEVETAVALQEAARLKRRAAEAMDRGDLGAAGAALQQTRARVAAAPACPAQAAEMADIDAMEHSLKADSAGVASKKMKYSAYHRRESRQPGPVKP